MHLLPVARLRASSRRLLEWLRASSRRLLDTRDSPASARLGARARMVRLRGPKDREQSEAVCCPCHILTSTTGTLQSGGGGGQGEKPEREAGQRSRRESSGPDRKLTSSFVWTLYLKVAVGWPTLVYSVFADIAGLLLIARRPSCCCWCCSRYYKRVQLICSVDSIGLWSAF